MFTSIFNVMQEGQVLSLHLMRKGGKLVVCFQPLSSNGADARGSKLTPLVITAAPGELDAGFLTAICSPLEERFGMLTNLEEFSKSTQKAQPGNNGKSGETLKAEPAVNAAPAKKSRRDEQVEEAERLASLKNLPGAYGIYKKLCEQDKTDSRAAARMHELWAQMSQKTIFPEEPAAETPPAVVPSPLPETEPQAPVPENHMPPEDMFAQLISSASPGEPAAPDMPDFDRQQYQAFLQYREFLKAQPVPEII